MFAVGRFYQNGLGTERNLTKAVAFYKQAAEKGHAEAKRALEALQDEMKKVEKRP
jgi:hypothetical protein